MFNLYKIINNTHQTQYFIALNFDAVKKTFCCCVLTIILYFWLFLGKPEMSFMNQINMIYLWL